MTYFHRRPLPGQFPAEATVNLTPAPVLSEKPNGRLAKIITALVLLALIGGWFFSRSNKPVDQPSIFTKIARLVANGDKVLKGEADDRVNVLLLGMGGVEHEGPLLTDTIIIASYRPSTNHLSLISLPRDLVIPVNGLGLPKINSLNAVGELTKYPGGGPVYAADQLSRVLKIPIQYAVRVDFDLFKQLVDDLGGIDVYVERSFTDKEYPTEDFGYQTIAFEQGNQHLDGEQALRFARSRHGSNGESSDFARSQRQQKILIAIKDKALRFGNLLSPKFITGTFDNAQKHVSTNLQSWEIIRWARLISNLPDGQISHFVFDDSPGNFLTGSFGPDGGYILAPNRGDYEDLAKLVGESLDLQKASLEEPKIVIQNGSSQAGLAYYHSQQLSKLNLPIVAFGNAAVKTYAKTTVYDLTGGRRPGTLKALTDWLEAEVGITPPQQIIDQATFTFLGDKTEQPVDFLVVLGSDAAKNYQQIVATQTKLLEQVELRRAASQELSNPLPTPTTLSPTTP